MRGKRTTVAAMTTGLALIAIAAYLFFFSKSFTFYTPYSTTSDWVLSLPTGMDYSISSHVGLGLTIGCFAIGSLLILISVMIHLRQSFDRSKSETQ